MEIRVLELQVEELQGLLAAVRGRKGLHGPGRIQPCWLSQFWLLIKHRRLVWLVNRNGFLAVLEAEKFKVRVPADLVCVSDSSGSQEVHLSASSQSRQGRVPLGPL